jgi:hypothetical protein
VSTCGVRHTSSIFEAEAPGISISGVDLRRASHFQHVSSFS